MSDYWEMSESERNRIFREALNGYGFEEFHQSGEGVYCTGCNQVHKRPTKMYNNGKDTLCKFQVINLYNPET